MGLIVLVKVPGAPVGPEGKDGYRAAALTCFLFYLAHNWERISGRLSSYERDPGVRERSDGWRQAQCQVQWKPLENLLEGGHTQ